MAEVATENVQQQRHAFASQASAVGSLRTINTAEITYASTYNHGYSSSLATLGPGTEGSPPVESAAGLIDEVLAPEQRGLEQGAIVCAPGEMRPWPPWPFGPRGLLRDMASICGEPLFLCPTFVDGMISRRLTNTSSPWE
jgi:hypothetical protein